MKTLILASIAAVTLGTGAALTSTTTAMAAAQETSDAPAKAGRYGGEFPSPAERFAALDKDGDGALTFEEFSAEAFSRFDQIDTNGDGTIDEDERPKRERRRGPMGAGPMDRATLEQRLSERFAAADKDGDGTLSLEELEEMRPQGRRRR